MISMRKSTFQVCSEVRVAKNHLQIHDSKAIVTAYIVVLRVGVGYPGVAADKVLATRGSGQLAIRVHPANTRLIKVLKSCERHRPYRLMPRFPAGLRLSSRSVSMLTGVMEVCEGRALRNAQ